MSSLSAPCPSRFWKTTILVIRCTLSVTFLDQQQSGSFAAPCPSPFWINNDVFMKSLISTAVGSSPLQARGGRYINEKLSKADKSVFLKLSATYQYRKTEILKLSKNYRYRKMHQIWSDKYMKSQSIRNSISANVYPKKARKISPCCLVTMKSSTDSILIFLHRQLRYNFWRYSVPFWWYFVPCRCFLLPFLHYFEPFYRILHLFVRFCRKIRNMHIFRGEIIEKIIESR